MTKQLNVRGYRSPTTIYGTLPVSDDVHVGERIAYQSGADALSFAVEKFAEFTRMSSGEIRCISELAFKCSKKKLGRLRRVIGFQEAPNQNQTTTTTMSTDMSWRV